MRKGRILVLFLCLCFLLPLFSMAEEELFLDDPDEVISDSDLFDFFEDDFFEEDPGIGFPSLQDLFTDENGLLTLDNEPINDDDLLGDGWWKVAPVLVAESQRKEGVVKLTWVQPGTSDMPPDSSVKYYIYAFDSKKGNEYPVGKAKSGAKKEVTLTRNGVTYTGLGNSAILKDQWAGTEYYVRAERYSDESGRKEYGISSNTVAFTGTDARWKMLDDFTFSVDKSRIVFSWFSPIALSVTADGDVTSGFDVDVVYYTEDVPENSSLLVGKAGKYKDLGCDCEFLVKESYIEGADYSMILTIPENITRVGVKVTPVKDGKRGRTSSTKEVTL